MQINTLVALQDDPRLPDMFLRAFRVRDNRLQSLPVAMIVKRLPVRIAKARMTPHNTESQIGLFRSEQSTSCYAPAQLGVVAVSFASSFTA